MKEKNFIIHTCQNQEMKYYNQIFLSRSVLGKGRLSICEFNFVQDKTIKLNLIKNGRKSQCQLSTNIFNKKQQPNHKPYQNNIFKPNNKQETIQSSERQNKQQESQIINTINNSRSEQKLPALSKFVLQLNVKQNPYKLIRVNQQGPKPKPRLKNKLFRQVSQKNSLVRVKLPLEENKMKQPQHQQDPKQERKKEREREYLLKKIMLNSGIGNEIQSKQRNNINILMSKLRQTERRGRQSVNFLQRKVERSPSQLTANKFQFEQISKSNIKEEIMKKFSLQLGISTKKKQIKSQNTPTQQQNYVSAWHVQGQNNSLEPNQQFL